HSNPVSLSGGAFARRRRKSPFQPGVAGQRQFRPASPEVAIPARRHGAEALSSGVAGNCQFFS
ncbi:MAG: hypothetical protein LBE62_04030, partial [Azonexus sp.]|nr:hypothetical protein [Azonexus sp.]